MSLTLLLLQVTNADGSIRWFGSMGAVISLVLAVAALVGMFVGYGRWLEKLNGVGMRTGRLEERMTTADTERGTFARQIDKLVDQHGIMLERLGEAKRSAETCHDDTEALGFRIGSAVSDLQRDVSSRLTRVETILQERTGTYPHSRSGENPGQTHSRSGDAKL